MLVMAMVGCAAVGFGGAFAATETGLVPELVKKMEARYRQARTLRATFLETYRENGKVVRNAAGTAMFRKPGQMRWEYESPEKNLFLVDGKYAWFYTPADRTATKMPARQDEDVRSLFALLAGEMKVSRVCKSVQADGAEGEEQVFTCERKPEEGEGKVRFGVLADGELARIVVDGAGSVETEFRFQQWEFGPELKAGLFQFEAPPGVVIVDGLLSSGDGGRPK